jgi:hypothetical protein
MREDELHWLVAVDYHSRPVFCWTTWFCHYVRALSLASTTTVSLPCLSAHMQLDRTIGGVSYMSLF